MRRFVTSAVLLLIILLSSVAGAFDTEELTIIETKTIISGQKSVDVFVGKKTKNDVFSQYEYYGFSNGSLLMYGVKPASGDEVIFPESYMILPPAPFAVGDTWTGYLDMPTKEKIEEIATTELFGKSYPSLKLLVSSVEGYPLVNKWYLDGVGMLGGQSLITGFNFYSRLDDYTIAGGNGYVPMAVGNRWHWIISDQPITAVEEIIPLSFTLHPAVPNPFNPSTVIGFDLAGTQQVRLSVYDTLGREIAILREGILPAGSYSSVWNGCDSHGIPAASGLYLFRLQAGAMSASGKMTLVR